MHRGAPADAVALVMRHLISILVLLAFLGLGCATPTQADETLGACGAVGTTTNPSTGQKYTVLECDSGAIILLPYNECRDNPDANCKEA